MTSRRSVSKRKRFEVFKRDQFTCQYCGAQPPDSVLEIDHIDPVSRGGSNEIENLITACMECNRGKSDKPLEHVQIRPDADLLYLETQQEIAELRRYQEAKRQRDVEVAQTIELLQDTWQGETGFDWVPSESIIRTLLSKYGPDIAEQALVDVAMKVSGGYISSHSKSWVPYLFGVAKNMGNEE